jgi:transcriptional regulator GlxA family with amidase domain
MRSVGIYLYDQVEVLDFAGPFEVFSAASQVASRLDPSAEPPFRVFTVGASDGPVTTTGGLLVQPRFTIDDHPPIDVLVVPGGVVDAELERREVVTWIAAQQQTAELTVSVCTGAFLLGRAGALAGKSATTHWDDIGDLRRAFPDTTVVDGPRWVDEGAVITAAGISAGLDVSLHIVAQLAGDHLASQTARYMDYRWRPEP